MMNKTRTMPGTGRGGDVPDLAERRWRGSPRAWPVLQGTLPIERSRIPAEVLAGATLAALGIPAVLGYAKIAGMPLVTGLYTMLLPMAVYAILGSSRHLVVAAVIVVVVVARWINRRFNRRIPGLLIAVVIAII